jgi:hypothetical protein
LNLPAHLSSARQETTKPPVSGLPVSAPDRVLAAELQGRGEDSGALAMMVSSMVRMVQAGQSPESRWKAS